MCSLSVGSGVDSLGKNFAPRGPLRAATKADIVLCATSSIDLYLKLGLRNRNAYRIHQAAGDFRNNQDLADKVCVHLGQGKPALVQADNLAVPDHSGDRGWKISDAFDFASCTTLPDLISGATNGRTNADERTCFVNDLGLGLQFAVVAGVTPVG